MPRPQRVVLLLILVALVGVAGYVVHLKTVSNEAGRLAKLLDIPENGVVAEIGAGKGDLAIAFARSVSPSTHVLASELGDSAVARLRKAVNRSNLGNLTVLAGSAQSTKLEDGSCDAIFMRRVYHHFTEPQDMARSLFASLGAGGRLAIIEGLPEGRIPPGVPDNRNGDGIRPSLLISELSAAGFRHIRTIENWDARYYLALFQKPSEAKQSP